MSSLSVITSEEKADIIKKAFKAGYYACKNNAIVYIMENCNDNLNDYLEELHDAENSTTDQS